jgi:transposase
MDVVFERCAGIDVHKRTVVVVCRLTPHAQGQSVGAQTQTFGTTTADLLRLADWLAAGGCTHVGLESTGEYWKPVYNLLEGMFTVWLLNAQHIKAVPGRKTDVKDARDGSPSCCATDWCAPASSRPSRNASCAS